jgi:cytochrome c
MKMTNFKKVILLIAGVVLTASCGGKKQTNTEEYVANESVSAAPADVDVIAQGEALVKASDCKICHHPTNKIVGPPHLDVAKKYEFTEANVKMLATKIISGGSGVWGEVPMAAHANVTQEDAEKMARYVLAMDGEKEH